MSRHGALPGTRQGSWFANQRLGFKLTLALGLLFFFMLALGLASLFAMDDARKGGARMASARLPQLDAALVVERDTYEAMLNVTAYALSGDEAEYSGGRQSLARIKEAAARLRMLALDALAEGAGNAFAALVDALHLEIDSFDSLAEETRTLVQAKERSWASFNASLAEADRAFAHLRALYEASPERFKELADLQNDFQALRVAIATALATESGMTLHSLTADFSRVSTRLLLLWQEKPEAAPASAAARRRGTAATPDPAGDPGAIDLFQVMNQARSAIGSLSSELETDRTLARDRRASAAKTALLARDMSRDALDAMHSEMEGDLGSLTVMLIVVGTLLFIALCGCFLVFRAVSAGIIVPLRELALFARTAADGDTTSSLSFSRNDELGDLAHSLRALVGATREAVTRMQHLERETDQRKRKAEQLTEKATEALRVVKKREQEIAALVEAIRERDDTAAAGQSSGQPPTQSPVQAAEQSMDQATPPTPVPPAQPLPGQPVRQEQEAANALRDLAEMSANMQKLTRQLADT